MEILEIKFFYVFMCYLLLFMGHLFAWIVFVDQKNPKRSCKAQDKWFSDAKFKFFLQKIIKKILNTAYIVPCVMGISALSGLGSLWAVSQSRELSARASAYEVYFAGKLQ